MGPPRGVGPRGLWPSDAGPAGLQPCPTALSTTWRPWLPRRKKALVRPLQSQRQAASLRATALWAQGQWTPQLLLLMQEWAIGQTQEIP